MQPRQEPSCVFLWLLSFNLVFCLIHTNKMSKGLTRDQVASAQLEGEYSIKSETTAPKLDTSQWPLLLKNYDKLLVRSSHFTPIPSGCSPLKRDIVSYIKLVGHLLKLIVMLDWYLYGFRVDLASSISINHRTPLHMRLSPGCAVYYE